MAVVDNTCLSVGDVLSFKTEYPLTNINSFTGIIINSSDETINKYFVLTFKYAIDGLNWSLELPQSNLLSLVIDYKNSILFEFFLTRFGNDNTGVLTFDGLDISTDFTEFNNNDEYKDSLFKITGDVNSICHEKWLINVLQKIYHDGLTPKFIDRDKDHSKDLDFIQFWKTITQYYSYFVCLSRSLSEFYGYREYLLEFLKQRNLFFCQDNITYSELFKLMGLYFDIIRKRGTIQIVRIDNISSSDSSSSSSNLSLVLGQNLTNEPEFDNQGLWLSPLGGGTFTGTSFLLTLNLGDNQVLWQFLGYTPTVGDHFRLTVVCLQATNGITASFFTGLWGAQPISSSSLGSNPTGTGFLNIVQGVNVFDFKATSQTSNLLGFSFNISSTPPCTIEFGAVLLQKLNYIKDKPKKEFGELLRLLCYEEHCDEFILNFRKSNKIGWNIGNTSPLYRGTSNMIGCNKAYNDDQNILDINLYPIMNIGFTQIFTDGVKHVLNLTFQSGSNKTGIGVVETDYLTNADIQRFMDDIDNFGINVDPSIDYTISFECANRNVAQNIINFGVLCVDENYNILDCFDISSQSFQNSFFNDESFLINNVYYSIKGILFNAYDFKSYVSTRIYNTKSIVKYNSNFYIAKSKVAINTYPDVNPLYWRQITTAEFNYIYTNSFGINLQMHEKTCKIVPLIYVEDVTGSCNVKIWDLKIKPTSTRYSSGFIGTNNWIDFWLKNRNLNYSNNNIKDIIRKYLIPYDSEFEVSEFLTKKYYIESN